MMVDRATVDRRALLRAAALGLAGAGGLVGGGGLVGCAPRGPTPQAAPTPAAPRATAVLPPLGQVRDVAELLSQDHFVVAHRGSGDNWPEHTLTAYRAAVAAGAQAVEISVRATADGELVCHHDADLVRTCGVQASVAATRYADLPRIDARRWLGPATRTEPIPRLADVLTDLPATTLAFVEDKDGTNTRALLALLGDQDRARDRFVWKQWGIAKQVALARADGYRTWGYFDGGDLGRIGAFADSFDCLGVPVTASDDEINQVTGHGLPVMAWAVHTRSEAARLAARGVQGVMCANVPYVLGVAPAASTDPGDPGRRPAGDLPRTASDAWQRQPRLGDDAVTFTAESASSYLLGSVCPLPEAAEITVGLGWPDGTADGATGIAFGLPDDADYGPGRAGNRSGAHRVGITAAGQLAVWEDRPGGPQRVRLPEPATVATDGSTQLQVRLTATAWSVRAGRGAEFSFPRRHGGGYLWLWADRPASGPSLRGLHIG